MARRCSHCSNNGHNSRTCPARGGAAAGGGGGVKLFGVRLTDGGSIMKKSASMGNLSALYHSSSSAAASPNPGSPSSDAFREAVHLPDGYASDDPTHASCSTNRRAERKKGVPWTEEEHRLFLLGLQKLGKGDWRGISRNYVTSRTPTQVASHAQKYFIRQTNVTRRKRRSSLFDMVADMASESQPFPEEQFMLPPRALETDEAEAEAETEAVETDHSHSLPSLELSLKPEFESMEATPSEPVENTEENVTPSLEAPPVFPTFIPTYIPIPFPLWPSNAVPLDEDTGADTSHHQILKPIPVVPKEPVNVDELVGMSQLSLGESISCQIEPSPLSLKLTGEPSRQSAFHASTPLHSSSEIVKGEASPLKAV
nr:transcription factor MYB1R1 [Ipomoea batatas]